MIDAVEFSWAGDKYLGKPYSEMDCQKFIEKCMADCGYYADLPGSNAWYRAMDWTGTPEECRRVFGEIPKGALLYILKNDGGEPEKYKEDGIGNASHIGIKTGRGEGAIHSSSSRGCVANSRFRDKTISGGWNRIGLKKIFDYGKRVNEILADPENGKEDSCMTNVIIQAENGGSVNLRYKPNGDIMKRVPSGTKATVLKAGNEWSEIMVGSISGYMKNEFLIADDRDIPPEGDGEVTITLTEEEATALYSLLQKVNGQILFRMGRG